MANLNFQQLPRSIANSSLNNRASSSGVGVSGSTFIGTSSNPLSDHVTPTSAMFPTSNISFPPPQSQLSPIQSGSVQLASVFGPSLGSAGSISGGNSIGNICSSSNSTNHGGRTNLFAQRTIADRRQMQGLGSMASMGSFMQSRGYGAQNINSNVLSGFHSVFGSNDTGTPPLLDLSEFPSLTNVRGNDSLPQSNLLQTPGGKPYVGMVKQPSAEQTEFQMSSEDFPALPGTQLTDGIMTTATTQQIGMNHSLGGNTSSSVSGGGGGMGGIAGDGLDCGTGVTRDLDNKTHHHHLSGTSIGGGGLIDLQSEAISVQSTAFKSGIQTSPDGMVKNIPASMVNNQFGMVGLLTFIRAAESNPNLVTLAMGQDLTGLGLNLNSQENLYPTFGGPFSDQPCRPQDIDFHVPPEYLVNMSIRDKLSPLTLKKYKDDLLFYLFYSNVGDVMQLAAAAELHNRDWRYHIEEKVWITRVPGLLSHYEKVGQTERGTFYYFDAQNWRRVPKDFQIDPAKLEKCPNLNAIMSLSEHSV